MRQDENQAYARALNEMLANALEQSRSPLADAVIEAACLPDFTDRAALETDRSLSLLMRQRDRLAAEEIAEALKRLETGEYGVCRECGEDIAPARLRARPTAALCVHCQALLESAESGVPGRGFEAAFAFEDEALAAERVRYGAP